MSRGAAWSDAEVKALIGVWAEGDIQKEFDGTVRNKEIYKKLATDLQEQGYDRDWEQCKSKIKNLKTEYRTAKDNNNETGKGRKTFKYYDDLDKVLGHRPASRPPVVLDASAGGLTVEPSQEGERDDQISEDENGKTDIA